MGYKEICACRIKRGDAAEGYQKGEKEDENLSQETFSQKTAYGFNIWTP